MSTFKFQTRMHSSRISTARSLTVFYVLCLLGGGGGGWLLGGDFWGWLLGGWLLGGGIGQRGVDVLVRGERMSTPPRARPRPVPDHLPLGQTTPIPWSIWCHPPPPPTLVGQTDACENITFARFAMRAVITAFLIHGVGRAHHSDWPDNTDWPRLIRSHSSASVPDM